MNKIKTKKKNVAKWLSKERSEAYETYLKDNYPEDELILKIKSLRALLTLVILFSFISIVFYGGSGTNYVSGLFGGVYSAFCALSFVYMINLK